MRKGTASSKGRMGRLGASLFRRRAEEYAADPRKLLQLLRDAADKARAHDGPLAQVWEELMALLRMLGAYAKGQYHEVPWKTLVLAIGAIVYFVMPLDLIPDVIAGLGVFDDAVVVSWTIKSIRRDVEAFTLWEENQSGDSGPSNLPLEPTGFAGGRAPSR